MKTELRIVGMTCKGCVRHVERALRERAGVTAVEVDLAQGRALVEHDGVTADELCAAIAQAGYEGAPARPAP